MKKVFTLIAGVALSIGAFAQQIPNGGFENWTSPLNPDSWSTIASAYGGAAGTTLVTKDVSAGNHVQGLASMHIINDTVPLAGMNIIGECGLGGNSTANNLTFFGYAYTKRPDTMFFYYKYIPATKGAVTDTAAMLLDLTKAGNSLFGGEYFIPLTSTDSQFVSSYLPFNQLYSGAVTGAPDTLHLLFGSGNVLDTFVIRGSSLWVDSVYFDKSVLVASGIEQLQGNIEGVKIFPNPATDHVNIAVEADEIGSQVQLIDMSGRVVYDGKLSATTDAIDTKSLQAGVYSIRVNSIDKMTHYKGLVTITK